MAIISRGSENTNSSHIEGLSHANALLHHQLLFFLLSMKPRAIGILSRRLYNRVGILKALLFVSLAVISSITIVISIFNYLLLASPLLNFYSFGISSNSSSSSCPYDFNSYSHSSSESSAPSSSSDSSLLLGSPSHCDTHYPPPPPLATSDLSPPLVFSPPPPVSSPPPPPVSSPQPPPPPAFSPPPPPPVSSPPPPPISSPPIFSPPPPLVLSPPPPILNPPVLPPLRKLNPPSNVKINKKAIMDQDPRPSNRTSERVAKECDYSQGEWVRDWESPNYTNMTCYTIQEHQNCMKFGRPDTDYLKWRWKPDGCELPRFDPVQFFDLMRDKSMMFVGDSLARNQMQSLMCLLSRVEYPKDISETSDENFKRMFYQTYNFTISIFWSPFLVRNKQTRGPQKSVLWNLYVDEIDEQWASRVDDADYVIISAGNWFNRPTIFYENGKLFGCLYCPSKRVQQLSMHYPNRKAFRIAFQTITNSVKFKGMVILRTISPSHFENGVWNNGGDCIRTKPFQRKQADLKGDELELYKAQLEEFETAKKEGKRKGVEFRLLDMTRAMLLRPDGHPSRYGHWPNPQFTLYNDCVHWCLPGPVDMWNDLLVQVL